MKSNLLFSRGRRTLAWLGTIFRREGLALWAGLRDPFFYGLLLFALLLAGLAFQEKKPFRLDVGRQPPDRVYLEGVHDVEHAGEMSFRWSRAEAFLRIPGLGQTAYRLDLRMAAPRFGEPSPRLHLESAGATLLDTTVGSNMAVYSILMPPEAMPGGNVNLLLRSDTFTPSGDPRQLGVVLERLALRPAGTAPVIPSPEVLLWTALSAGLAVLLARRLGWGRYAALGAGAALALALAGLLAWARPLLTPGLPFLPLGLVAGWAALVLFQSGVRRLFAGGGAEVGPRTERLLWTVVAFFLAVRLMGVLHPALETWDLCFHYHRLESVLRGEPFFTIVSGEWRGLETLYLPSLYLLQAPFWVLFGGRLVPLKIAEVLLDTSAALGAAYIARRLLGRGSIVPLTALLYLSVPYSYLIFSWGIVSNALGQWLSIALLALLVSPAGRLPRWSTWLGAALLLTLTVLSHPGAVLLAGTFLAALSLTALAAPPAMLPRPTVLRWVLAGIAAVALAVALYYSHFAGTMWNSLQQMAQGANLEQPAHGGILVRGQVIDADLGLVAVEVFGRQAAVVAGVQELAAEARAYYHTAPLMLAVLAPLGLLGEKRLLALRLLALALLVALGFAVVGLIWNLYVRYMYFLLPFVAMGAAWWLARLGRRGRAGRTVAVLSGVGLVLAGLYFWGNHVLYYAAGCR